MVLFVLRKLILQTRMRSHPVGLNVWFLVGPSIYFHTSCVRTAKALVRLRRCAGSPKPSQVAYVISTIISCAGWFRAKNGLISHQSTWTVNTWQRLSRSRRTLCAPVVVTSLLSIFSKSDHTLMRHENIYSKIYTAVSNINHSLTIDDALYQGKQTRLGCLSDCISCCVLGEGCMLLTRNWSWNLLFPNFWGWVTLMKFNTERRLCGTKFDIVTLVSYHRFTCIDNH